MRVILSERNQPCRQARRRVGELMRPRSFGFHISVGGGVISLSPCTSFASARALLARSRAWAR